MLFSHLRQPGILLSVRSSLSHLLPEGLSLKEIGDHLGRSDPRSTRIYAKVDLMRNNQRTTATQALAGPALFDGVPTYLVASLIAVKKLWPTMFCLTSWS